MRQYERGLWASLVLVISAYAAVTTTGGCTGGNELSGGSGGSALGGNGPGVSSSRVSSSSEAVSSSTSASSTGVGGSGGAGVGGAGGSGGSGGATSASSAASTAASTSASTGAGGGSPTQHLVILAAGHTSALGASFDVGTSTWTTHALGDASDDRVGLAFDGSGLACGAVRSTSSAKLDFFLWNDQGSGSWSAGAQLGSDTTLTGPAMSGGSGLVDLVFQGSLGSGLNKFFYAQRDASWAVSADPVGGGANQSFSPAPAAVTRLAQNVEIAFAGSDGDLYTQEGQVGAWGAATAHGLGSNAVVLAPAITTLVGDAADLMVVYVVNDATPTNRLIKFTTHTSSGWSPAVNLGAAVYTSETPAVTGLANGDALVVYRGSDDGKGYFSRWTGSPRAWTVPAPIASDAIPSAPSAAPGVTGADAEIVYLDATGAAVHARLLGTTITTSPIGGTALTHAAIASQ
jgi:hypothetical protein